MPTARSDTLSFDNIAHTWTLLSGQVEAFLAAWEAGGPPPNLQAFVPSPGQGPRRLTLIELIKVDLEFRWRDAATQKRVEEYFGEFPELEENLPTDLIYEEFLIRKHAGNPVTAESYLARFPVRAAELQRLFGLRAAEVSTAMFHGGKVDPAAEVQPGDQIDDFDLLTRLGKGAFASVFLARQRSMQRLVALKVSANRGNEPQTLAQLDHEHIVRVYDQRELPERGLRLMYMQFVAGGTLHAVVDEVRRTSESERGGRLLLKTIDRVLEQRGESGPAESILRNRLAESPWPEAACWLGARLARALDYAHRMGVLHRDLKPANVLVTAEGSPKLADFNISFSSKVEGASPAAYFGGSLAYMSPEQLEACHPGHDRKPESLDGRSDMYSLGVMLWELITGSRPFADEQVSSGWTETLDAMIARRRIGLSPQTVSAASRTWPPGLGRVLATCLEADVEKRFATGAELARQLELCLQPKVQKLLAPAGPDWRRWTRRFPLVWLVLAALVPNALAAVFNYYYNRIEIIEHLKDAKDLFFRIQMVINAIAFPFGLGLAAWFAYPVATATRRIIAHDPSAPSAEDLRWLRKRSLLLGHLAAWIGLSLWLLAAPAYPIALSMSRGSVHSDVWIHFVASLTLCGLVAATYPFFAVSCLSVGSLYPVLVRFETMTRDDQLSLARLSRSSWVYLLLTATVPLLAVGILVIVGSQARYALGILAAGGLVGLGIAFAFFRTLQADLTALIAAAAPPGETRDTTSEAIGSFWSGSRR